MTMITACTISMNILKLCTVFTPHIPRRRVRLWQTQNTLYGVCCVLPTVRIFQAPTNHHRSGRTETLFNRILDVSGSTTAFSRFSVVFLSPFKSNASIAPRLDYQHFLTNPLQFISHASIRHHIVEILTELHNGWWLPDRCGWWTDTLHQAPSTSTTRRCCHVAVAAFTVLNILSFNKSMTCFARYLMGNSERKEVPWAKQRWLTWTWR
jgi:hypothetical protein